MARQPGSTIPKYKRRQQRSLPARIALFLVKLVLAFLLISLLWVLAYRFINPLITATMLGDVFAGRGAAREVMPISRIDRDMVRAAIAAEDSKFCSHDGFDLQAIETAMQRNASGGRIRGGSTISQQTAKNAFLWQGGGYFRKGLEAWFTLLIEQMWPKRRIMEVYLNLAETGIGTYGVNAGSKRYFGHDASAMTRTEAARIAAVLPLPKSRGAIAPKGFTRGYGNTIARRIGTVARDRLDACVYQGTTAPPDRTPARTRVRTRPVPGEEYETPRPLPPVEQPVAIEPEPSAEQPVEDSAVPPAELPAVPEETPPPEPFPPADPPPDAG
jgi:monofunctional biosynthetic peptidoglycan transglycosylase